jgi:hypothetical protein
VLVLPALLVLSLPAVERRRARKLGRVAT